MHRFLKSSRAEHQQEVSSVSGEVILPFSLAKTLRVLTFTSLTMLQASAQTVDFKVCRHFGEGVGGALRNNSGSKT